MLTYTAVVNVNSVCGKVQIPRGGCDVLLSTTLEITTEAMNTVLCVAFLQLLGNIPSEAIGTEDVSLPHFCMGVTEACTVCI